MVLFAMQRGARLMLGSNLLEEGVEVLLGLEVDALASTTRNGEGDGTALCVLDEGDIFRRGPRRRCLHRHYAIMDGLEVVDGNVRISLGFDILRHGGRAGVKCLDAIECVL